MRSSNKVQEAQPGLQKSPMNPHSEKPGVGTQCGKVNVSPRSWIFLFLLLSDTPQMTCPGLAGPLAEPGWMRLGLRYQHFQMDLRAPKNPSVFLPVGVSSICPSRWPCLTLTPAGATAQSYVPALHLSRRD